MVSQWIGPAQHLFIPLVVTNVAGFIPPPANFKEYVQRRLHYDPDPLTGLDRSISSYFADVSYGRAALDARVSDPVTVNGPPADDNFTLAAINAQPNSHLYEYVAVFYPANQRGTRGMAQIGAIPFIPARKPNRTKGRARFLSTETTGTWAMELLHIAPGRCPRRPGPARAVHRSARG